MKVLCAILVLIPAFVFAEEKADIFEREDLSALAKDNPKVHRYRVSVQRSFDPELVFDIEIWHDGTDGILVTKKARMEAVDSVLQTTKLVKNSKLRCNSRQIQSFVRLVEQAEMWTLPETDWTETTVIQGEPVANSIMDGSVWTIEAIKDGKYRRLTRMSPGTAISLMPDEIVDQIGAKRIFREGILFSACVWLWVLGDESDEEIY